MSKISELSLTKIVDGIKKKDFTSEEVTKSFIDNSKKSKKLNSYITECFDEALKFSKNLFGCFDLCLTSNIETKNFLTELNVKNVVHTGNIKLVNKI